MRKLSYFHYLGLHPVLHFIIGVSTFPLPGGILRYWRYIVVLMELEEFVMSPRCIATKLWRSTNYAFDLSECLVGSIGVFLKFCVGGTALQSGGSCFMQAL